jgi:hypothetical protein
MPRPPGAVVHVLAGRRSGGRGFWERGDVRGIMPGPPGMPKGGGGTPGGRDDVLAFSLLFFSSLSFCLFCFLGYRICVYIYI